MRSGISITVSSADRQRLEAIVSDPKSAQKHVWRAKIVLLTDEGLGTSAIMAGSGKSKTCVWRWQERFMRTGVDGLLHDATRPPGKEPVPPERVAEIVRLTQTPPPHEATHWTLRAMAKAAGVAASTVQGIWKAHGLSPHRWRQFKLSNDKAFVEKLTDLTGEVIGQNMQRHRHQEFIRFLNRIERDIPAGKIIHVVLDNYAAHKTPEVRRWLDRHPRWTFHFTPTSSSWLNAVEGFFAKLTRRRLKYGVFNSVIDLQTAINRFIAEHNETEAKPFTWTADPDKIIQARNRGFQTLESIH